MPEVVLRQRAQLDIESIFIYLALEAGAPRAARETIDAIYSTIERIADLPESGMRFASEDLDLEYRRELVRNYWVYYTFDDSVLTIWRIFHTRQDIDTMTLVEY